MAKTVGVYERPRKRGLPRAAIVALVVAAAAAASALAAYFM
jgi:hypothetical protein